MDDAVTQAIASAYAQARVAESARIELRVDHTWEIPPMPWPRRRGGLLRPVIAVAKLVGKRLLKAAARKHDWRHRSGEGVIDLHRRRYMLDFGSYACLYEDGNVWDGRSGRLLSTLPPDKKARPEPLWLLDILAGVTCASAEGADDVRGTACRRFAATADLSRASKVTPGGVAVPKVDRFEDLLALPIQVWVDDEHVRRVRFGREDVTETLELWDFGVPMDALDWARLPTFRSPQEAAAVASRRDQLGPRAPLA